METQYESKVGTKGELFPPSKLRKKLGLKPGMKVVFYILNDRLIVEPVPDLFELLASKTNLEELDHKDFQSQRGKLSVRLEGEG